MASSLMVQPSARAEAKSAGRHLGDALTVDVVGGHAGVEGDRGQDRGLGRGVVPLDVGGRVGLGVAESAGVGEGTGVVGTGAVHLGEDVVGGAVDDSGDPQHGVARQRLGQRADDRDRTGDGGLEVQVDVGVLGGLRQFACGHRHQRLVGGDDRLALFERAEDGLAGRLDRPHQLDDDVDVVAGHQLLDVVGEQFDRHAAVVRHPAHPDAAQHERRADAGGQVAGALLDDADHFAADVAEPQHGHADGLFVTVHGVTSLPD